MNLSECFDQFFEIISPDSDALKKESQKLRYQVYCVENAIFDSTHYQDALEWDIYDSRSVHRMIRHKASGLCLAHVRLILAHPEKPETRFPIEQYYERSFYKNAEIYKGIPRQSLAEISRLFISKQGVQQVREEMMREGSKCVEALFRQGGRRKGDNDIEAPHQRSGRRFFFPGLILGLFRAIRQMALENQVKHFLAVLEPALLRRLKEPGICFTPIGPLAESEYFIGKRLPCYGSMATISSYIQQHKREVWHFLTDKQENPPASVFKSEKAEAGKKKVSL